MTDPLAPPAIPGIPGPRETLDGRWEVRAMLPGAMGTVLLLTDPATGGRFAAKTPRVEQGLSVDTLRRFEAEARTWLSLGHHENVVEAFFYETIRWRDVERPFLFLEYVDGPTLDRVVKTEGRLAVPVVLDVASGIAWGMSHAHGEGRTGSRIVHRDLKPDNVFITTHRVVKVSDFGIARALDRPEEAASEGLGLGTPFYASPEQMRDARRADVRSDVYSFGAVLHELIAGEPPFPAADLSTLVWKVLREEPRPLRERFPEVPEALDRLVLDCLAKEPTARPAHFTELLARLAEIREDDSLWTPGPGSRSCEACGWLSLTGRRACSLCGKRTTKGVRYAPSSPRWDLDVPTLGRSGDEPDPRIEGVQIRPRTPRAGEEVVVTVLVGNHGSAPAESVSLPYARPSRDAFAFVEARGRRGFRGTVPPTAEGAPLRVSWTLRPLRPGRWTLRAPRISWRSADGRRRVVRGDPIEIEVQANDSVPLVGRAMEREELARLVARAAEGTGTVALVLGHKGLGKSRLAREFLDQAAALGFAGARGRCLDRGVEIRGALKEALRTILDLPKTGASGPEVAAALVGLLGDAARGDPRLLPFLTGELTGRPAAAGESPAYLWGRFAAVAGRVRPVALVVEDVQRDPEVAAIVHEMAAAARRDGARFSALLSARPEADESVEAEYVRRAEEDAAETGLTKILRLAPLTPEEVSAVVRASFRPNDFDTSAPWLADEIHTLSGGNPLFVSEIIRGLRTRTFEGGRLLATKDGAWTAGPALTPEHVRAEVPPRLEQLVVDRVAALPPVVRRFALTGAILGDVFETDLLRRLLADGGADPATFDASLAHLEEEGILREVDGDPPRIRFREPLLPDALQAHQRTTDPEAFRRLHARAADLLAEGPQARGRNALRLARHLRAAGLGERAFPALLDAAHRLIERQAYRRASAILAEGRELLAELVGSGLRPKRAERMEFALLSGDALRSTGDYAGALAAYGQIVEESGDGRGSPSTLAGVYAQMGRVHEALGQIDDALYCHAVALSIRREQGLAWDVPSTLVDLASLHLLRGEVDRTTAYLAEALGESERAGNPVVTGRALILQARLLIGRGETRPARSLLRRGLREARAAKDDLVAADAWTAVGQACHREGRPVRALGHFRRALRLRQHVGDLAAIGASWAAIGAALEGIGDLENAQSAFDRAAATARRTKSARALASSLTNLGRVQLSAGFPRKARGTLDEAWTAGATLGEATFLAATAAELALTLSRVGEAAQAESLIAEALRRAIGRGDHDVEAYVLLRAAEIEVTAGHVAGAQAHVRAALSVAGVSPQIRSQLAALAAEIYPSGVAQPSGSSASAASATAAPVTVAELADLAVELAAGLPSPSIRARALAAQGRCDLRAGDRARAASRLRQAAGLLLSAGRAEPLLYGVLIDLAVALAEADPDAAAAARARSADLARELRERGFAPTWIPLDPSAGDA